MDIEISKRLKRIKPSQTLAVSARARKLRAEGKDVIGLGAGEPDFDTPEHIKHAAVQALREGQTKYTAVGGIPELKSAIITKFARDNALQYSAEQIIVSNGAKQCFFNLCQAVLNPGDEVVIPSPYWVSYPDITLLADGVPVPVYAGLDQGFKITPSQLDAALTERTRLFILNSPCNPTGAAFTRSELAALGEVLERYPHVVIATDEIYEHIYWGEEPCPSFASTCPNLYARTVTINGVSKAYAMTGWRIGYAAGPQHVVAAMQKIQGQSTSNAASVSQWAATAALAGDQSSVKEMNTAFKKRHDYIIPALNALPGFKVPPGVGAFYAFPDVSGAIGVTPGVADDVEFAEYLLQEAEVALVPGTAFGAPAHLRLSFATDLDTLKNAVQRLEKCLAKQLV